MVEILDIPMFADRARIIRKIRTKARGCGFPDCWPLREPAKSNELMWLRAKDVDKRKGRHVPVRRVLYYLEYKTLPLKQITMICEGGQTCINPAHMRIRGFESECNDHIESQIEKGWLRPEDAERWFDWHNDNGVKIPESFECDLGRLGE